VRRYAAWPATTPWHCATHSRTTDAPHPRKRTAVPSKGRQTTTPRPRKDNAVTTGRRDRSPPSPSALCDHPRRPQHHPGHCITIPDAVGACGDRTPPRRLLCLVRPHVDGTLESSQWVATEQATPTPPPSKPILDAHRTHHDALPEARFARTTVCSMALCATPLHVGENSAVRL
jgi:hypothetical protein